MDYKYVDETADIARGYTLGEGCNISPSPHLDPERRESELSFDHPTLTKPSILGDPVGSYSSEHCLPPPNRPESSHLTEYLPYPLQLSPRHHSSVSSASPHFSHSSQASPGTTRDFISQIDSGIEHGLPNLDEHEACLMRYFVVQLAPWVCDSDIFCLSHIFSRLTLVTSLIYVMARGILLAQYPFELGHVHLY